MGDTEICIIEQSNNHFVAPLPDKHPVIMAPSSFVDLLHVKVLDALVTLTALGADDLRTLPAAAPCELVLAQASRFELPFTNHTEEVVVLAHRAPIWVAVCELLALAKSLRVPPGL